MKKSLFLSLIILFMGYSVMAQAKFERIQVTGEPSIYLNTELGFYHIPSADIYNRLFSDWNDIKQVDQATLNGIPNLGTLDADTKLVKDQNGNIYFFRGGKIRSKISNENMILYHFNNMVTELTQYLDASVEDEGEADEEGAENY